ncbi:MAG: hypothetical protein JO031_16590, partial [Ktedonobacteraceae bacterium]|nr:hypothetical protein [Ktedonobacteraceae bacterium]
MFPQQLRAFLPCLTLAALLVVLSGCGWRPASSPVSASNPPDRVQIAIHFIGLQAGTPVLTLTDVSRVRQLYTTVMALSPLPQDAVCTLEAGPSYTLTFLQGGKTITTATAQRSGCGPVSLTGEKQNRETNQAFWSQLDQAIFQATPVARPHQLAILHTLQIDQPPQTAQITSAEMVQRLYQAILVLPRTPQNANCLLEPLHEYQLVFHSAGQAIPSVIDKACNTISLDGNYKYRSGTYAMNAQFKLLFKQILNMASFKPARP